MRQVRKTEVLYAKSGSRQDNLEEEFFENGGVQWVGIFVEHKVSFGGRNKPLLRQRPRAAL